MQVVAVLEAMPSSNLKPEGEDGILEEDRVYRTTYMFSATMPPPVERLARKFMRQAAVINIGSAGKATDNVTQKVLLSFDAILDSRLRIERLSTTDVFGWGRKKGYELRPHLPWECCYGQLKEERAGRRDLVAAFGEICSTTIMLAQDLRPGLLTDCLMPTGIHDQGQ